MAEAHDKLVTKFRAELLRKKLTINRRSPFVDYLPDVYAVKGKLEVIAEIEDEKSLEWGHTSDQLLKIHRYVGKSKNRRGFLVVPRDCTTEAAFLLESLFGDRRIAVRGL